MSEWQTVAIIERRYLRDDGRFPYDEWRFYSQHNWDIERANLSVTRLNRQAPCMWEYRVRIEAQP